MTTVEIIYLICAIIYIIAACGFILWAIGPFILECILTLLYLIFPPFRKFCDERDKGPDRVYVISFTDTKPNPVANDNTIGKAGEEDKPVNDSERVDGDEKN